MTGAAGGTQAPCALSNVWQERPHAGNELDAACGTRTCAEANDANAIAKSGFMVGKGIGSMNVCADFGDM